MGECQGWLREENVGEEEAERGEGRLHGQFEKGLREREPPWLWSKLES
jgi:hypothetical protein